LPAITTTSDFLEKQNWGATKNEGEIVRLEGPRTGMGFLEKGTASLFPTS